MKLEIVTDKILKRHDYKYYNEYLGCIKNIDELIKFLINHDVLTEIADEILSEYYSDESEIYLAENIKDEILSIIENNSDNFYFRSKSELVLNKDNKEIKKEYESYNKFSSGSYSLIELILIADEISKLYENKYKLFSGSENQKYFNHNKASDLIEYLFSEIESKFNDNFYLMNQKIIISLNDNNILNNNHLYLSDELLDSEIDNILLDSDLYSSCLYDLYESDYLNVYSQHDINKYEIFEDAIIDYYNDELSLDMKYNYAESESEFYKYDYNISLELTISDLIKINSVVSDEYSSYYDVTDNKSIYLLFENLNNSSDPDSFIYSILDYLSTELYENSDYYENYYYELVSINSSNYKFIEISDIYELIEIVLNEFKHYDLRNSFKFSDELYEL